MTVHSLLFASAVDYGRGARDRASLISVHHFRSDSASIKFDGEWHKQQVYDSAPPRKDTGSLCLSAKLSVAKSRQKSTGH